MPRDHAQVNVGIWNDPEFRALPPAAQHLYFTLWTHPTLSYCGVVDWRPGRIAASSGGWTVEALQQAADCLQARYFLVIDEDTEECLIRSWVRWDGLMKQPRLAVSYANAYSSVASNLLRGVIIDELHKLKERTPDLAGLAKPQVVAMLDLPRVSAKVSVSVSDPFGDGFTPGLGETLGELSVPPTPFSCSSSNSTTPAPVIPRKHGQRLDPGWIPSEETRSVMALEHPDIDQRIEHAKFVDYWTAKTGRDATKLDWDATWRNWIRNAKPTPNGKPRRQAETDDMFAAAMERAIAADQRKALNQ